MKALPILLAIGVAAWSQPGINVSQVTHDGQAYAGVALSPDGKLLAYVQQVHDSNSCSLRLHDNSGGPDRVLRTFAGPIQIGRAHV